MPDLMTRLKWFDRGAEAVRRTLARALRDEFPPGVGPVYICPTYVTPSAFQAFVRKAVELNQLTAEHAPPKSAGGRAIALTCAECNHTAGSRLDAHASHAAKVEDDAPGTVHDHPVRVALGGVSVNMTMSAGPDGLKLFSNPDHNSPKGQAAFFQELDRLTKTREPGWALNLQYRERFDADRAGVSWLRAAYIVAFAKFGYRLILNEAFHVVRAKMADPTLKSPALFGIRLPDAAKTARTLIVIREPRPLADGLAVQMGRHLVLLPGSGDLTFYNRIEGQRGGRAQIHGTVIPWPVGPEFLFDFNV